MSGLGFPTGSGRSSRAGSDASQRSLEMTERSGSMTTPSGRVRVVGSGTTASASGQDMLSMQAVNARIKVYGTDKMTPIYFDITLFRKDGEGNNNNLPGIDAALIAKVEAVFANMSDADIDKMQSFRMNFSRSRNADGEGQIPKYEFKNFSTRSDKQADYKDYKVKDKSKLGVELGHLCAEVTRVHNDYMNGQDSAPVDETDPASSKKGRKAKARGAGSQGLEGKGDGKRGQGSRSLTDSERARVEEDALVQEQYEEERLARLRPQSLED